MKRMRNRIIFVTLIFGTVAAMSFLVIISPLALRVIASNSNVNWTELSNVGQTYGAVSALLAAFALSGVVVSILVQNRELRHNRWEAGRSLHYEIVRMALDDPFYRKVFSALEADAPESETRLVGYINMILGFWAMMWEFGDWSEEQLRINLQDVLGSDAGRSYWSKYGSERLRWGRGGSNRGRAFERIADEVYRDLRKPLQDEIKAGGPHPRRLRATRIIRSGACALGVVAACIALFGWKKNRKM